jgi:uncharacterized membrane protein YeaQ/YmgE (transglycosylase-associated protein family)
LESPVEIVSLVIQIASGAIGGNLPARRAKTFDRRVVVTSMLGIVGGVLGGQLSNQLGFGNGPPDVLTVLTNVASGGFGGAWLTFLVGAIRASMTK